MTPDCPSCGTAGARELGRIPPGYTFAGRVLDQAMGEADMYRCRQCHVGFRWPQPSAEELSELYQLGESDQWTYEAPARVDWQIAARILEDEAVSRVLDVGCFEGGFLVGLPERIKRFGIEISREAAAKARDAGIEIVGHTIEESATGLQMDAVTAFDVIEHVHSPAELLRHMAARTAPGGLILVSSGNLDSHAWRFMGPAYWYSALPEHLSFTSPAWATHEAERLGLTLERSVPFSHAGPTSIKTRISELAKNALYRTAPGVFAALRRRGLGGVDVSASGDLATTPPIWITATDQYLAVFRKRPEDQRTN